MIRRILQKSWVGQNDSQSILTQNSIPSLFKIILSTSEKIFPLFVFYVVLNFKELRLCDTSTLLYKENEMNWEAVTENFYWRGLREIGMQIFLKTKNKK